MCYKDLFWFLLISLNFVAFLAIQASVTPLGDTGVIAFGFLPLNMYTAAGWVNVLLGLINLILLSPCVFVERPIAAKEAMLLTGAQSGWYSLMIFD